MCASIHCCPRRPPKLDRRLFRIVKVEHQLGQLLQLFEAIAREVTEPRVHDVKVQHMGWALPDRNKKEWPDAACCWNAPVSRLSSSRSLRACGDGRPGRVLASHRHAPRTRSRLSAFSRCDTVPGRWKPCSASVTYVVPLAATTAHAVAVASPPCHGTAAVQGSAALQPIYAPASALIKSMAARGWMVGMLAVL
jgi:hypothetical protein